MKTAQFAFLGCLLISSAFQAHAETASEYDALYSKCVAENGPINNSVVAECADTVSQTAKAEITRRYKSIHARLLSSTIPQDAARFEAAQKAWLQYRNIHCDLAGSYVGSPKYSFCPMNLNAARALELRELDGE